MAGPAPGYLAAAERAGAPVVLRGWHEDLVLL